MKLTAAEKSQIKKARSEEAARAKTVEQAWLALAHLTDDQAVSIATQLDAEYRRVTGARPTCTCGQQSSDPTCPAARAGWGVGRDMECSVRPAAVAYLRVSL